MIARAFNIYLLASFVIIQPVWTVNELSKVPMCPLSDSLSAETKIVHYRTVGIPRAGGGGSGLVLVLDSVQVEHVTE